MNAAMITTSTKFKWTPQRDAFVAECLRDGMTGQQIGVLLGISRMAVIGRVHRVQMLKDIGFRNPAPQFKKVGKWVLPAEIEPHKTSAPEALSEPIPSSGPFPPSEPSRSSEPTRVSEPNYERAPATGSEPHKTRAPEDASEPEKQREPIRLSVDTPVLEPVLEVTSGPRYVADVPQLDPDYSGPGVPLLRIRDGLCRFPLWPDREKGGPHYPMCGKQALRQSRYCQSHTPIARVRRTTLTLPAG